MAWQDNATYIIKQNFLNYLDWQINAASTPVESSWWGWYNAYNYIPSRPVRFVSGNDATLQFNASGGALRTVNCLALINIHTGTFSSTSGNVPQEVPYRIGLTHSGGTPCFDSGGDISSNVDDIRRWGNNLFVIFDNVNSNRFDLTISAIGGSVANAPSVGCVLLGQYEQLPSNPLIAYQRTAETNVSSLGRAFGSHQWWLNGRSRRVYQMNFKHADENSRVDLEALIVGRGNDRGSWGLQEFARARADIPVALIGPEMWYNTTDRHGGCMFGRFTGFASSSIVGGRAVSSLTFEEIV